MSIASRMAGAIRGGTLLADDIYHGLTYGIEARSALAISDEVFVINSFSKYFGMTGWRLGWLVAPQRHVREIEIQDNPIRPIPPGGYCRARPEKRKRVPN